MTPKTSTEIRQAFLDFFQEMGHEIVPSSPIPLLDNPTLLFTNAGMNQFVGVFLGKEEREYKRAASSQKCMRVQGKHNDLENVGPSPRHHTFFEMLGNFSFGDYFKSGAIRYGYDFLTKVCEIPEERLWYTVHEDDQDAYDIWVNEIRVMPERVIRMGDKTNFWMMGDVGPCGPTSEIHYDWGPEHCTCGEPDCGVLLDNDCGRWLELWNLVFMQFDQAEDGSRTPLPHPGVDTGLGLERITAVVEQEPINYNTDLFLPAMKKIQEMTGDSDDEMNANIVPYRVIADHGRASAFLIADGVLPGNLGKGYVLRMIIRRASRFGRSLGFSEPFLGEVAQVFIDQMSGHYSELKRHQEHIHQVLALEERRFTRTLDSALAQMDQLLNKLQPEQNQTIPGDVAFNLYATYGLPLEITRDVAGERGFSVDARGFRMAREAHAEASGAGAFGEYDSDDDMYSELQADLVKTGQLEKEGVDYDPYSSYRGESDVLAILVDGERVQKASAGTEVEIVTSATPFYAEAGGEVSDTGWICSKDPLLRLEINDTKQPVPGMIVHAGLVVSGEIQTEQLVELEVDNERRWDIRRNHTATHILHKELRRKLGDHVTQQGSLVAPDRLRFDFSHGQPVSNVELAEIELAINETILSNKEVTANYMPQKEAIGAGAMALFGEKYGDIVRTIQIGNERNPYSFELCGGLHVQATGDIGSFYFVNEEAVGAGLRRVEAVTGRGAYAWANNHKNLLDNIAREMGSPIAEVESKLALILNSNKLLQKEISQLRHEQAREQFEALLTQVREIEGVSYLAAEVSVVDMNSLREMADWFRGKIQSGVAVLATVVEGRVLLVVTVTDDLVSQGVKAGEIIGQVARIVGGGGGGRPTLAQAGGKDPDKLPVALARVPAIIASALEG